MRYWSSLLSILVVSSALAQDLQYENQIYCRAVNGERIHGMRTFAVDEATVDQLNKKIRVITVSGESNGVEEVTQSMIDKARALEKKNAKLGINVECNPNRVIQLEAVPNDYSNYSMWGLTRIAAQTAWNTTTGSSSVKVAVIDTGIQYNHPDLSANMNVNTGEIASNGIDDDANGYIDDIYGYDFINSDGDPMDDNSHGTHCAGTIGAKGNNGVGLVGVNWTVGLIAVKVLAASGSGSYAAVTAGIGYATDRDADVISLSLGGGSPDSGMLSALRAASSAGIFISMAAGNANSNNNSTPTYPSQYAIDSQINSAVSVLALDSSGNRASYSNYGSTSVHIGAPGSGIWSTIPLSKDINDGVADGYASFSGTSMATPHVAGLAALLKAANPALTGAQIKDCIINSGESNSALAGVIISGKEIDAASAMSLCGGGGSVTPTPTPPPGSTATPTPVPTDPSDPDPEQPDPEDPEVGEYYLDAGIVGAKARGASKIVATVEGGVYVLVDDEEYGVPEERVNISCNLLKGSKILASSSKSTTTDLDEGAFISSVSFSGKKVKDALKKGGRGQISCLITGDNVSEEISDQRTIKFRR